LESLCKGACAKCIPSTKDVSQNKQNIFFLLRLHSILLGLDIINYSRLERVFFWIFIFDIIILLWTSRLVYHNRSSDLEVEPLPPKSFTKSLAQSECIIFVAANWKHKLQDSMVVEFRDNVVVKSL
jgi:hypothetical protein